MIVSAADVAAHLGLDAEDTEFEAAIEPLLTRVEAMFLAACGRGDRPFLESVDGPVTETTDGTGSTAVFTDYPLASIVQVTLGDIDAPRLTLAASDLAVRAGQCIVRAKDGSTKFGTLDEPNAVHITYTPQVESPEDARQAILRAAAALYLQRGAEDVKAESEGGVRSDFASPFEDPTWHLAVAAHRELAVG